ncbi:MAG: hypothetical protein ACE5F6_04170 [Anaerolineae bacterium]
MKRRTVKVIIVALCLSLTTIGIALAQPDSPLVGIPHMSDQPDGAEVREFPAGIDTIYLVFDYETDGPVEIIAEIRSEEQQGAVIFNGQETYSGTGTANVEIPGPGSASFPDGVYDTIIRFGDQRYITAGWEWVVGDVPLPAEDTSGGQAPISPLEQGEAGSESTAGSSVSTSPIQEGAQSTAPAQTTPGLSPVILIGVGVVVLLLLSIIAWAVRGFMTAES